MNSISEWIVSFLIVTIILGYAFVGCVKYSTSKSYCESLNASYYKVNDESTPVCMKDDGSIVPIKH